MMIKWTKDGKRIAVIGNKEIKIGTVGTMEE